jgi:hypothetical protein
VTIKDLQAVAHPILKRVVCDHPAEAAAISRLTGLSLDQFKFVAVNLQMLVAWGLDAPRVHGWYTADGPSAPATECFPLIGATPMSSMIRSSTLR